MKQLCRIDQKKRDEIDQKVKKEHSLTDEMFNPSSEQADFRIKAFMEEDPHLKDVYRDTYTEIKEGKTLFDFCRKYQGY